MLVNRAALDRHVVPDDGDGLVEPAQALDNPNIAHSAIAKGLQSFLVSRTAIGRRILFQAWIFGNYGTLLQPVFVNNCGISACENTSTKERGCDHCELRMGRKFLSIGNSSRLANMPVKELSVSNNGQLRPVTWYGGKGMGDVRTLSAELLLSLQDLWRRRGDEILERVADQSPELLFPGMIKLPRVLKVEVGGPGDFTRLSKQGILEKLQEKAGPEARKLFEKFMADVEKLQAQQDQKDA